MVIKKNLVMKSKEPDLTTRFINVFADYLMLLAEKKMKALVDCSKTPLRPGLGEKRRLRRGKTRRGRATRLNPIRAN